MHRFHATSAPFAIGFAVLTTCLVVACGAELPPPPLAPPLQSSYEKVPYPPPPARVEYIPKPPSGDLVWIDGQWLWQAQSWRWQGGGFLPAPPGLKFSPWRMVRSDDGDLFYSRPQWINGSGKIVPSPTITVPAKSIASTPLEPEQVEAEDPVHGPDTPGHPAPKNGPAPPTNPSGAASATP